MQFDSDNLIQIIWSRQFDPDNLIQTIWSRQFDPVILDLAINMERFHISQVWLLAKWFEFDPDNLIQTIWSRPFDLDNLIQTILIQTIWFRRLWISQSTWNDFTFHRFDSLQNDLNILTYGVIPCKIIWIFQFKVPREFDPCNLIQMIWSR